MTTPRRLRFTSWQLSVMECEYAVNTLPDTQRRARIASLIGATPDNVRIWFQNQRKRRDATASPGGIRKRGSPKVERQARAPPPPEQPSPATSSFPKLVAEIDVTIVARSLSLFFDNAYATLLARTWLTWATVAERDFLVLAAMLQQNKILIDTVLCAPPGSTASGATSEAHLTASAIAARVLVPY